jgi:hypothetical protein
LCCLFFFDIRILITLWDLQTPLETSECLQLGQKFAYIYHLKGSEIICDLNKQLLIKIKKTD